MSHLKCREEGSVTYHDPSETCTQPGCVTYAFQHARIKQCQDRHVHHAHYWATPSGKFGCDGKERPS